MFGGSPQFKFVFYRLDRLENVRSCAGWSPQLTNESVVCLAGHHSSCLSSIGQIDMTMFVALNLQTNIVKFDLA